VRALVILLLRVECALVGTALAALVDAVTGPAGTPRPAGKAPADAMSDDAFALLRKAVAGARIELETTNTSDVVRQLKSVARGGDREHPLFALLRDACGAALATRRRLCTRPWRSCLATTVAASAAEVWRAT